MKKWFKFFGLSFFSHKISKEAVKRGFGSAILGFVLALIFIWSAFIGGDMIPFGLHYKNSPEFREAAYTVLANADADKRIYARIEKGDLLVKRQGGEYIADLLVNTLESDADKQSYAVGDYNLIIDTRPADTLADIEAYCLSNDGKNTEISYQDYLTLSEVARLNFDFKIRYTGKALELTEAAVEGYKTYLVGLGDESRTAVEGLAGQLAEGSITQNEYNRAVYELYFENYYPEITEYESTSKVPLLRNYYYHHYIKQGLKKYLFIFDDYITGSFETKGGISVPFYGFYSNLEEGAIVGEEASETEARAAVDGFIKSSFRANWYLNVYAYIMNIFSLAPFIALMLMVATLLTYSVLKLLGTESITSLGAMFKIVGSFSWFSAAVSALLAVILSFFVGRSLITALPIVIFFVTLVIRCIVFAVTEHRQNRQELEKREAEQKEG